MIPTAKAVDTLLGDMTRQPQDALASYKSSNQSIDNAGQKLPAPT